MHILIHYSSFLTQSPPRHGEIYNVHELRNISFILVKIWEHCNYLFLWFNKKKKPGWSGQVWYCMWKKYTFLLAMSHCTSKLGTPSIFIWLKMLWWTQGLNPCQTNNFKQAYNLYVLYIWEYFCYHSFINVFIVLNILHIIRILCFLSQGGALHFEVNVGMMNQPLKWLKCHIWSE